MKKEKMPQRCGAFPQLFAWLLVLPLAGCACSAETALQEVFGLSAEAPEFTGWRAVSTEELSFSFSLPVSVKSVQLEPPLEIASITGGSEVRLFLAAPCEGGIKITADMLVEDAFGNTLQVLTPLRARNDRMPALLINEVRTEYSKPKVEFIEFYTLSAGNLGGMRLYLGGTPEDTPFYEFSPIEVADEEYIVLHLRTLDEECQDETGEDLAAIPYTKENEARISARDLWIPGAVKNINKKGAAVYLVDQDDRVLDALIFCDDSSGWWKDEKMAQAAEFLAAADAWTGSEGGMSGPADAASSAGVTATRTLNRRPDYPDSNTASDWYVTVTSGNSPGQGNNENVYQP
ncbi:MAG: hypothetical protein LBQ35_04885 [Spirochaetaceae bacterium]|jgi:hypothetical protein|nr:hypothetical protein [Spirochaetaceae bacterium]